MGRMSQYERRRPGNAGRGGARRLPVTGNTRAGKKGLSVGGGRYHEHVPGPLEPDNTVLTRCRRAVGITSHPRGVREQALEPRAVWEGPTGKAAAANRTREIRPSGMRGGLVETWSMAELGTHGAIERAPTGHSSPTDARATLLPDNIAPRRDHVGSLGWERRKP